MNDRETPEQSRWLVILYIVLSILVVWQSMTHGFVDEPVMLRISYMLSDGLNPYTDFFEHHVVFNNFLLVPVFFLFGAGMSALIAFHILSIAGVIFTAWLVFRIAKREEFKHPHLASIFFLVGYTALPMTFLRNEFFSLLFIILFFFFSSPLLRGFFLVLLAGNSPMMIIPATAVGIAYLIMHRKDGVRSVWRFIAGGILGILLWLIAHTGIYFTAMYDWVFVFNNKIQVIYGLPFKEVLFFTFFFTIPLIIVAFYYGSGILREKDENSKKEFTLLALLFTAVFVAQMAYFNVVYEPWTRIKLPNALPVIGLLTVFVAAMRKNWAVLFILAQLALTLFVYTPSLSLPRITHVEATGLLDSCVAENATIRVIPDDYSGISNVILFRQLNDFYWHAYYVFPYAEMNVTPKPVPDEVNLCTNGVSRKDIVCDNNTLERLQNICSNLRVPTNAYGFTRKLIGV